jgi:hypothetical protein
VEHLHPFGELLGVAGGWVLTCPFNFIQQSRTNGTQQRPLAASVVFLQGPGMREEVNRRGGSGEMLVLCLPRVNNRRVALLRKVRFNLRRIQYRMRIITSILSSYHSCTTAITKLELNTVNYVSLKYIIASISLNHYQPPVVAGLLAFVW